MTICDNTKNLFGGNICILDEHQECGPENAEHNAETKMLRGELDAAKAEAKKAHDENSQWFRDYSALCNEKADLLRKLDALDDSHLKELEQEVCKKDQTLKSVNSSLYAFQTFAKELCSLLGSTPLSVSNAIHIIDTSGLTGDPAKAAMSLFLGYVDAATTYMQSSVGGGGIQGQLTDWSGRKLNESDKDFIHRCIDTVKSITAPKQVQAVNVAHVPTYRRKR